MVELEMSMIYADIMLILSDKNDEMTYREETILGLDKL